jgi:hypothetical protein
MPTNDLARLTTMEAALLMGRGFSLPVIEQRGGSYAAIAIKGKDRAEALGPTRDAAARNLVLLITRR